MRYGATTAVDGLSLTVARRSITAVLGPNGAGKTTTLETCEGYRAPQAGTVRVLGLDPPRGARAAPPHRRDAAGGWRLERRPRREMLRHIGALHAHPLDPALLQERLGLTECGRTPYRRLSGGLKQRLGLADGMGRAARGRVRRRADRGRGLDPAVRRNVWVIMEELREDGADRRAHDPLHGRGGAARGPHPHHRQGSDGGQRVADRADPVAAGCRRSGSSSPSRSRPAPPSCSGPRSATTSRWC